MMMVLHITPSSCGYERVELLANGVSKNNHLALIVKDGEEMMTGGLLLNDDADIIEILDQIPKDEQYGFVRRFKETPFVQMYAELTDHHSVIKG